MQTPPRRAEPKALFHDRDEMERAVRALVQAGVSPQRIRVSETVLSGGRLRPAPEYGRALVPGLVIGAVIGATVALLWILGLRSAGVFVPFGWLLLRMLGSAASGAVVGALVAVAVRAVVRGRRGEDATPTGDYVVTVDAKDERTAAGIRDFLMHRGGGPAPA